MKQRKAYPVSKWKVDTSKKVYQHDNFKGRDIVTVIIGEEIQDGKTTPITEGIFKDVCQEILDRTCKVYVDIYATPMIVVSKGERMVMHNGLSSFHCGMILSYLREQDRAFLRSALQQMTANRLKAVPLGKEARTLRGLLKVLKEEVYNYYLVEQITREYLMEELREDQTTLQKAMEELSNQMLLDMNRTIIEQKLQTAEPSKQWETLVQTYPGESVEQEVNREIALRVYTGRLCL